MSVFQSIELELGDGTLSGYVVDAHAEQIGNYLSEHTDRYQEIADQLAGDGHQVALLRNMAVEHAERGKGVGNQLVSMFMSHAEDHGASAFLLIADTGEVQADGFDLVTWYESFGFTTVMDTSAGPLMAYPADVADDLAELQ